MLPSTINQGFFDYEKELRTNPVFAANLINLAKTLKHLDVASKRDSSLRKKRSKVFMELWKAANYNLAVFLPYFFPKYPYMEPFSLKDYPFAYAMYNLHFGADAFLCIKGSRQIAKTTNLALRDWMMAHMFPKFRLLTVVPRSEQMQTLAQKYGEVAAAFRFQATNKKNLKQNDSFKQLPNGSFWKMMYILTDPDKSRGNTVDALSIDEYQDFDPDFEFELEQVVSASSYQIITKTGTSKSTDTALEFLYNKGSKSLWCMPCTSCNHENLPTFEYGVLDMIQKSGVCCAKCGKQLNVRNGFWYHESNKMAKESKVSLHVPKIIVPAIVEDPQKWYPIYKQSQDTGRIQKFGEEVLGIATEQGSREITQTDLQLICTLGTQSSLLKHLKNYQLIFSGCDWGGSDQNVALRTKTSYTVHVIIGVSHDWKFHILHMRQHEGADYQGIAEEIAATHKSFRGFALASDDGGGQFYNNVVGNIIGRRSHVIFKYETHKTTTPMVRKSLRSQLPNLFMLQRTDSISSLYHDIKTKRVQCYNWEEAEPYLLQCTNLYRVISDKGVFVYNRASGKPDDILHGLNYAVTLAKICIGEPAMSTEAQTDIKDYLKNQKSIFSGRNAIVTG